MAELVNSLDYVNNLVTTEVIDMKNPLCHDCNECCSMTAILSDQEYEALLGYISHGEGLGIYKQGMNRVKRYYRKGTVYWMCPFTSDRDKKCRIYDIRPQVCRDFHCSTSKVNRDPIDPSKNNYMIFDYFFDRKTLKPKERLVHA